MLHYVFQIYFIFLFFVIIQVNYGIVEEYAAEEAAPLSDIESTRKCTAKHCTCGDIPQWNGVDCKHADGTPFPLLNFTGFKYLPERMFLGLRIFYVSLWEPDVTVADNVFEGMLGLDSFYVIQSSIKVIDLFILMCWIFSLKS